MPLWRDLIEACNAVESDIRENERRLQMHLDCDAELHRNIIHLLKRTDITNEDKINTLKSYFMIEN